MTEDRTTTIEITPENLASLGEGHIAYVRAMKSEDVTRLFPGAPELAPGHRIWALLSANGTPIMLADNPSAIEENAMEQNLATVSVH